MKLSLGTFSMLLLALSYLTIVQGKGGGGGGGRGGGGGGRGGGKTSSGKGISKSRAAVLLGSGAAGYAAYRAHKNSKKDQERGDKEDPDFDSYDYLSESDYKLQESTSYYATEGIGMSAWAIIFVILGIIAIGTVGWYCCNVFLPVWEDNRQMRRRSMMGRMKDEVPLQETPSTATPSP